MKIFRPTLKITELGCCGGQCYGPAFGQQANFKLTHKLLTTNNILELLFPLQIIVYERLFHDCAQPKQQSVQHKTLTVQLQHSLSSLHNSSFPYNYMKNRYTLTLVHKKSPGFPTFLLTSLFPCPRGVVLLAFGQSRRSLMARPIREPGFAKAAAPIGRPLYKDVLGAIHIDF